MRINGLLAGAVAALAGVSGARAADAVTVLAEPEPMEYVRVCDTYGTGFFYIPGTETCLQISGYVRYDIGVGDLLGIDVDDEPGADTYYKRARFALRVDARSETELGTLRGYAQINFQADLDADGYVDSTEAEHVYIELGGFRIGMTDSLFSTFTSYAGGVINDDLVGYGPFATHQVVYNFDAGNGFTAAVGLEGGNDGFELVDYMPHVVGGAAYTKDWGAISGVVGYDSVTEEWAAKGRLDVTFSETASAFVMVGYSSIETGSYYANWVGDWAVWGGASVGVTDKATVHAQLSYDEAENFAAVLDLAYELVPGLTITPEVAYSDNLDDDEDGDFGGYLRFERAF